MVFLEEASIAASKHLTRAHWQHEATGDENGPFKAVQDLKRCVIERTWWSNSLPGYRSAPAGRPVRPPWIHDPCFDGTLFRLSPAWKDRRSAGYD
jgi:hypothetical protein